MNNTRPSAFFAALLRIRVLILLSTETEELGTRLAGSTGSLVPRPFIQRVYRDPCWGWLGLGPRQEADRAHDRKSETELLFSHGGYQWWHGQSGAASCVTKAEPGIKTDVGERKKEF